MIYNERLNLAGKGPIPHNISPHLEQLEPLPLKKRSRLGDCSKAVGHVGELQSSGWREISRELASDPERDKGKRISA